MVSEHLLISPEASDLLHIYRWFHIHFASWLSVLIIIYTAGPQFQKKIQFLNIYRLAFTTFFKVFSKIFLINNNYILSPWAVPLPLALSTLVPSKPPSPSSCISLTTCHLILLPHLPCCVFSYFVDSLFLFLGSLSHHHYKPELRSLPTVMDFS